MWNCGAMGDMQVRGAYLLMVGSGVMFGMIITEIIGTWSPVDKEVALANTILNPVKTHVHGFGLALADSAVGDSGGSRVIGLDRGGRLGMAHFDEGSAEHGAIFGIVEEAGKFSFSGGGHDIAEDVADSVDGTIVGRLGGGWLGWISRFGAEEEVATDTTFGFGFREIGGIAMDVEYHIAGMVADDGIGMGGSIVK